MMDTGATHVEKKTSKFHVSSNKNYHNWLALFSIVWFLGCGIEPRYYFLTYLQL